MLLMVHIRYSLLLALMNITSFFNSYNSLAVRVKNNGKRDTNGCRDLNELIYKS